jgi:alkaline phosphatase D
MRVYFVCTTVLALGLGLLAGCGDTAVPQGTGGNAGAGGVRGTGGVVGTGGTGDVGGMGGVGGSGAECDGSALTDFPNGVAAGDVDQSSVVLWARASCAGTVRFEYGRDPDFVETPDGSMDVEVADPDEPAKAHIIGLLAGTQYYYRASRGSCAAPVAEECGAKGSFRTPHASGRHGLRFGVSSCFRGDMRPFVSIKNVPARDLDFFAALGDIVYADSDAGESGELAQTLNEFRYKHELAYSKVELPDDNMFARLRASTALFVSIDDHEVDDNFAGGAPPMSHVATRDREGRMLFCENPDTKEIDDNCDREFINETDFFNNGLQAFEEYNPIREERYGDTGDSRTKDKRKLYRFQTFGKDAALFVLDTRSFRDEPEGLGEANLYTLPPMAYAAGRTMLGEEQHIDLRNDLLDAQRQGITWKFVLVPEPIQNLGGGAAADRFEGYARERSAILKFIRDNCIGNVAFITGDIHGTIANNLAYRPNPNFPANQYSASWDISTGPVAYDSPYGSKLIEIVRKVPDFDLQGSQLCPPAGIPCIEPFCPIPCVTVPTLPEYESLPPEAKDIVIKAIMDLILTVHLKPWTGLGFDGPPVFVPDIYKQEVFAKKLLGSYVSTNTLGWTEFEIDRATQKLTVKTYGIQNYTPEVEIENLLNLEPRIVSQFEVHPQCGCAPRVCVNDDDCCYNTVCNGLGCVPRNWLENDKLCVNDDACQSGSCSLGKCAPCKANGEVRADNDTCCSNICNAFKCAGPNSIEALKPCTANAACISGNCVAGLCAQVCGDGSCDGLEQCGKDDEGVSCRTDCGGCPNGHLCIDGATCQSRNCCTGICRGCECNAFSCEDDVDCCSGQCRLGHCSPI